MTADLGQPGQIIDGKYRITRLLGTGGMGAVYEGENIRIRRKVAIKMLHGSVSTQADVVARFEREAQAAALVGSEHICEVLDLGELPDHTRYMVMEYLEGETLSSLIKRTGRVHYQQSIPILVQILDALGAAHAAGIIHRDLKPDNVFILPQRSGIQNFVKILDFGVSKFSQLGGEAMNVTRAGAVVGTPYYMSPEQARGSSGIDQRTDIYAIGVLLYQATTGQVPYQAETFNELLFKIVLEVAPPPQTYVPDLDPTFAAIIQRAMAREPDQRFQNCAQFKEALLAFQRSRQAPMPAVPGQMPQLYDDDDAGPLKTAVMDPNRHSQPGTRSGAQWPAAFSQQPSLSTMPMQPGLAIGASTGGGGAMSPMHPGQSGPNWAVGSNPGAAQQQQPQPQQPATATTANAWGNASSPSANIPASAPPKSKAPVVLAVLGIAALLGIGGAVAAFTVYGKGKGNPAQAGTSAPTATASAAPSATPSTTPSASAAPSAQPAASAIPSAEPTTAPSATPTIATTAKPAPSGKVPAAGASSAKPAASGTGKAGKAGKKSSGNDLGY